MIIENYFHPLTFTQTEPYAHDVEWVNEKLQKSDEAVEEECKDVKACSMKEVHTMPSAQRVPEPDPLPGISFDTRPDPIQF